VGDQQFGIVVLDALTGAERLSIRTPGLWTFAYSPNNLTIIVGYTDGTMCAFDARSGKCLWSIQAISPDMGYVASIGVREGGKWVSRTSFMREPKSPHRSMGTPSNGIFGVYDLAQGKPRLSPVEYADWGEGHFYSSTLRHVVVGRTSGSSCWLSVF